MAKLSELYDKFFLLKIYQEPGETMIKSHKSSKGFTPIEIIGTLERMIYELNKKIDNEQT